MSFTYFRNQLAVEWSMLKTNKVWIVIAIGLFANYVNLVMHSLVFYIASVNNDDDRVVAGGPENRLLDLGFSWLPEYHIPADGKGFAPSNVLLYSLMVVAVLHVLYPLFFKCYYTSVQIFWRTLLCMSLTITARVLSFIFTVLPSPAEHCNPTSWDPPTLIEVFFKV